ncbi:unnamed protein product, partial [Mesorhabditis spiculigera]
MNETLYKQLYALTAALLGDALAARRGNNITTTSLPPKPSYNPFYDETHSQMGLRTMDGKTCMSLPANVLIMNPNIGTNDTIPYDFSEATLAGDCSEGLRGNVFLAATIRHNNRTKTLRFSFHVKNVWVKQYEELRWQLSSVEYGESYGKEKISFEGTSSNIAAPLNQRFVCRDKLNVTLSSKGYMDVVLIFPPDFQAEPYGPKSNLFICERTRRRSLRESLETKTTVFSGVILALSSIAMIATHSVRRHMMPERKEQYLTIAE